MQLVGIFRFVEVLVDAPAGATLTLSTDVPGNALAIRETAIIGATQGRHPFRMTCKPSTKGKLYTIGIKPIGNGTVAIYKARVYARALGPMPSIWQWWGVPVMETPDEWAPYKLPIPETPDQYQLFKLPIPETPDNYTEIRLPIPPTPDDYSAVKLPIPPTPDGYGEINLPVKPTPVVPDWVQVPVDN